MKRKRGKRKRGMSDFEVLALKILSNLALNDKIDEDVIEFLRQMQMEHYTLLEKYEVLEERINIDNKTSLLKYNEVLLVNIVKAISRYWQASSKSSLLPISYLRMDLDDFSRVNNIYGHDIGDNVLIAIAKTMKKVSRPTDYLFRFGGEEFDIVLPVTDLEGAEKYAQKLLKEIRKIRIPLTIGGYLHITASIGGAAFNLNYTAGGPIFARDILEMYHKVQKQADFACYHAKSMGKDRFCSYKKGINYEKIMEKYGSAH
jgi:diguanylate cyclase (GGDEF)-like protein